MELNCTWEQFNEAHNKWESGMLCQQAFSFLNADEREFVMTGILPEEWDEAFPD